jgi:hypothetical protein
MSIVIKDYKEFSRSIPIHGDDFIDICLPDDQTISFERRHFISSTPLIFCFTGNIYVYDGLSVSADGTSKVHLFDNSSCAAGESATIHMYGKNRIMAGSRYTDSVAIYVEKGAVEMNGFIDCVGNTKIVKR